MKKIRVDGKRKHIKICLGIITLQGGGLLFLHRMEGY
jgi:hypothetical protein